MALTFPLPIFFAGLPITKADFDLNDAVEISQTGGGEILSADLGSRLWTGTATLRRMYHREAEKHKATLNLLRRPGRSFMVFNPAIPGPASDPTGSYLSAVAPVIDTLATNNRELTIGGLPNGFFLDAGDMLAFSYSASPTRYALHQIAVGSSVDATGKTGLIEVSPNIRAGAAVGSPITLYQPACKAVLVPGSVTPGTARNLFTEGVSFQFIQTLR